jgi:hypothetical protein
LNNDNGAFMSKLDTANILLEFKWRSRAQRDLATIEPHLAPDFFFDCGILRYDREGFCNHFRNTGAWSDIEVLATLSSDDKAAVFFDGTDDVTGLRHRTSWLLLFVGPLVWRIFEASSQLLSLD